MYWCMTNNSFTVERSGAYAVSVEHISNHPKLIHVELLRNGDAIAANLVGGCGSTQHGSMNINMHLEKGDVLSVRPRNSIQYSMHVQLINSRVEKDFYYLMKKLLGRHLKDEDPSFW